NFTTEELVDHAIEAQRAGFWGFKVKVGLPHVAEDAARLAAVRRKLGPNFEIMIDANQRFTVSEAIRRAKSFEEFDLAWSRNRCRRKISMDMCGYHNRPPYRSQLASRCTIRRISESTC